VGKHINQLYYITHVDNVASILKHGIVCHRLVEAEGIQTTPIYDTVIVSRRGEKRVEGHKTLWDYANLYFQARNPMLYRVVREKSPDEIVVLGVRQDIRKVQGALISDGNAASEQTCLVASRRADKSFYEKLRVDLFREWWSDLDGSKRRIMSECLIPQRVPPDYIQTIYTANLEVRERISGIVPPRISVVPDAHMFFEPTKKIQLAEKLFLVQGDMFFSQMQTLTISVNCVGVMGKGLASRAKYQFPDVYVHYQDLCKQKKLRLGRPVIYRRGLSQDYELADEPSTMSNGKTETWFLLFPTKDHWKQSADFEGIKKGLQWVVSNYKQEGVRSLAMPALGCGLGWLDWSEVGPVLCTSLAQLDIETWVYLPAEQKLSDDLLNPRFLIRRQNL